MGAKTFHSLKGGAQNVLPCPEEGGAKSFGPAIFPFCRPPLPGNNDQSLIEKVFFLCFFVFFLIHFSIYIEIFQCCLYLLWTCDESVSRGRMTGTRGRGTGTIGTKGRTEGTKERGNEKPYGLVQIEYWDRGTSTRHV